MNCFKRMIARYFDHWSRKHWRFFVKASDDGLGVPLNKYFEIVNFFYLTLSRYKKINQFISDLAEDMEDVPFYALDPPPFIFIPNTRNWYKSYKGINLSASISEINNISDQFSYQKHSASPKMAICSYYLFYSDVILMSSLSEFEFFELVAGNVSQKLQDAFSLLSLLEKTVKLEEPKHGQS